MQFFYNLSRASVAGLSVDLCVWGLIGNTCLWVYTVFYLYNPTTIEQYRQRYLLIDDEEGSNIFSRQEAFSDLLIEGYQVLVWAGMCYQQYLLSGTWVPKQSWSWLCRGLVIFFVAVGLFILWASTYYKVVDGLGYQGLKWLDFVNWLWLVSIVSESFQLIPQLMLDFIENCTKGLSSKYVVCLAIWVPTQIGILVQHFNTTWTYGDGYWIIVVTIKGSVIALICTQMVSYPRHRVRHDSANISNTTQSHNSYTELQSMDLLDSIS